MTSQAIQTQSNELEHQMFDMAAELFQVMSAPMRLRIINALCDGEKHVSYLLNKIDTTQPNMSQHLATLYHAGIVGKRRDGVHIYYRVVDKRVASLCRAVCTKIQSDEGYVDYQI